MTPEQARKLLEGTTPAPWEADDEGPLVGGIWSLDRIIFGSYFDREDMQQWEQGKPEDTHLMAAAPDMAEMIANMRPEYAVQGKAPNSDEWLTLSQWSEELPSSELELGITLTDADKGERWHVDTRIAVRYVTEPQPLGEEQ